MNLQTLMFWLQHFLPQSHLSTYVMEGKLKILETNQKSEEITHFNTMYCAFWDFHWDVVKRKCPCLVGIY